MGKLWLVILLLLTGCQPQPPAARQMDDYLQRLSRVLEVPHTPFAEQDLSEYRLPERRQRLLEVPPLRMGLFELLVEARHCRALQQHLSQRNSSLGRMMPASHRLAADGELLHSVNDCLQRLHGQTENADLQQQLQHIAQQRRESLLRVFWNALNGSSEFEQFLRFADQPLPTEVPAVDLGVQALQHLADTGKGLPARPPRDQAAMDMLFDAMQRSRSGELIHSLLRLRHTLQQASALLESPRAARLCPQGRPTPKAQVMLNILNGPWAEQIQPQLANLQRLGEPWARALADLQAVPDIPPATGNYLRRLQGNEQALWDGWQLEVTRHTRNWQQLLEQCGLQPGRQTP